MKNRIYLKHWLALKPYDKETLSDAYYLKLSNEIKETLQISTNSALLFLLSKSEIDLLSCFIASYFEDLISGTNIWNTFINYHQNLYGKKLPFYNTDEYYENEGNLQDIQFLIWYFIITIDKERVINPHIDSILTISKDVLLILDREYQYAPENNYLKTFYQIDKNETDFYKVRNVIHDMLFKTYLFHPDTAITLREEEDELIEKNHEHLRMLLINNEVNQIHTAHTKLLSLTGKEWVAEIIGNQHPLYDDLLKMSPRIEGYFLYKGQNETDIFIEHIASGKKFNLTKKSYDVNNIKEGDPIMYLGIVKWRNEWWFSGINFSIAFNANLILDEKNSLKSRMAVNFIDHNLQKVENILQEQLDSFLKFNNGSPIAFMASDEIENFNNDYIKYFNENLNLSDRERKEADERAKKEGFFNRDLKVKLDGGEADSGLVFFNSNSGVEMAFGINSAFPDKNNPFFDPHESDQSIKALLFSSEFSLELVNFCLDNFKTQLPFFTKGKGKDYLDDIDFLLRFWKSENYHTKPEITFTGQEYLNQK